MSDTVEAELVGYRGAHNRLVRLRGPARDHSCVDCSQQAAEWSYVGPPESTHSTNPNDYQPRCCSCHRKLDKSTRERVPGQQVMSGAELKVHLTGMGLTSQWLASCCGANVRTVLRWYDADRVPPEAVAAIDSVTEQTNAEMNRMAQAGTALRTHRVGCSDLNDLPASWHRALTYRVLEYRRSMGIPTTITYG